MKLDQEIIISEENIKPSSPTPPTKKIHSLSLLDQIVPPIYVPLVLYYPNLEKTKNYYNTEEHISQTVSSLKQSLSSTLSHFYPLAGRLKDSLSVDCNDEGILFVVVKHKTSLSKFLENPNPLTCRAHIPHVLTWAEPGPGSYVAKVQVNFFDCGGISVGSLFFHKVTDGVTIGSFMKAWAAASAAAGNNNLSSGEEKHYPDYKAQTFFPHNELMKRESHLFSAMRQYFKFGKTVMKRFVFDSSAISTLRDELAAPSHRRPTRVEIVSALVWKWFVIASNKADNDGNSNDDSSPSSLSLVSHGVNMRRKSKQSFSDTSFGNFVWIVPASSPKNDQPGGGGVGLRHLFDKVRGAIAGVDADFVGRMEGEEGYVGYCKNLEETWNDFPEKADYLAISSWCNFGLYGVDFGWGRPAWISKCDGGSEVEWPFINVLWLMDTKEGDGVEAWLTLDEKLMAVFDEIDEIKYFASVDPSPLSVVA